MEELYKRFRPRKLDHVSGQDGAIKTLKSFGRDKVPHAVLFTGPSGCGKTTLARIMAKQVDCADAEVTEVNCADNRGIELARDLRKWAGSYPLVGERKVKILDECFPPGTIVQTQYGPTPIEVVRVGDRVPNAAGEGVVTAVFTNRVELDRVVRVTFHDGRVIYTTKQHEFLTQSGWVEAQHLGLGTCLLRVSSYTVNSGLHSQESRNEEDVPLVRTGVLDQQEFGKVLFSKLRTEVEGKAEGQRPCQDVLSRVSEDVHGLPFGGQKVLFPILSGQKQVKEAGVPECVSFTRSSSEDSRGCSTVYEDRSWEDASQASFIQDEDEQSVFASRGTSEGESYQAESGYSTRLEGREGREWEDHRGAANAVRLSGIPLEVGGGSSNQTTPTELPPCVQDRSGSCRSEVGYRGRWEVASVEKGYLTRCQEDQGVTVARVACVEVYERGRNDAAFVGVVEDQDRSRGYVEFHDLEVEGHHSYHVDGVLVHNCQSLTKDAQSAMLKLLEDTPNHVFFFLCTTDPQKLLPTIITRCTEIKLKSLSPTEVKTAVERAIRLGKLKVHPDTIDTIINEAEGSARKALVLLDQVKDITDPEEQSEAVAKASHRAKGIELAKLLVNPRCQWAEVGEVLKNLDDEVEGVRHLILSYCNKILIGGGALAPRCAFIIDRFQANFFDSKAAGLTLACWEVISHFGKR